MIARRLPADRIVLVELGTVPNQDARRQVKTIWSSARSENDETPELRMLVHHGAHHPSEAEPYLEPYFGYPPVARAPVTEEWMLLQEFTDGGKLIRPYLWALLASLEPVATCVIFLAVDHREIGGICDALERIPPAALPSVIVVLSAEARSQFIDMQNDILAFSLSKVSYLLNHRLFICSLEHELPDDVLPSHGGARCLLSWQAIEETFRTRLLQLR